MSMLKHLYNLSIQEFEDLIDKSIISKQKTESCLVYEYNTLQYPHTIKLINNEKLSYPKNSIDIECWELMLYLKNHVQKYRYCDLLFYKDNEIQFAVRDSEAFYPNYISIDVSKLQSYTLISTHSSFYNISCITLLIGIISFMFLRNGN